jgi:hypothetical protein
MESLFYPKASGMSMDLSYKMRRLPQQTMRKL